MSATVDNTAQIVNVGALVHLDADVLSHGIAFISKDHPPMIMLFELDEKGYVFGYEIKPVATEGPHIRAFNFVKVGAVPEAKSAILGLRAPNKLILPGG